MEVSNGATPPALRLKHTLGTHCHGGTALLLGEDKVLHCTGRWLVEQQITGVGLPRTAIVHEMAGGSRLTSLCAAPNGKFIAVCDQREPAHPSEVAPPPQLRVVHVQSRRPVCVLTAALEGALIGCSFSADTKQVLAYSGEPNHMVVVWQWAEERPVGMYRSRTPLQRVLFNPWIGSLISLHNPMRLARLNEQGRFKEVEVAALKRYGATAVDHCWLAAKVCELTCRYAPIASARSPAAVT